MFALSLQVFLYVALHLPVFDCDCDVFPLMVGTRGEEPGGSQTPPDLPPEVVSRDAVDEAGGTESPPDPVARPVYACLRAVERWSNAATAGVSDIGGGKTSAESLGRSGALRIGEVEVFRRHVGRRCPLNPVSSRAAAPAESHISVVHAPGYSQAASLCKGFALSRMFGHDAPYDCSVWWFKDVAMFFEAVQNEADELELDEPLPTSMSRDNATLFLAQSPLWDRYVHVGDVPPRS